DMTVYPSGWERAVSAAAMDVLPPGLFSMTSDWPVRGPSALLIVRARKSEPPPAGYGTIQRLGCSGHAAWTPMGLSKATEQAAAAAMVFRIFMVSPVFRYAGGCPILA